MGENLFQSPVFDTFAYTEKLINGYKAVKKSNFIRWNGTQGNFKLSIKETKGKIVLLPQLYHHYMKTEKLKFVNCNGFKA